MTVSERELLARVGAGERFAMGELYERHVRPVYRFALAELRSREDAEDVTHEVFLALSRRARGIDLPGESVLPWLLVTCRYLCRNRARARLREALRRTSWDAAVDVSAPATTEDEAARNALRRAVRVAVDALGADDRRLFDLCIDGEASYAQAALALGLSHAGVRNRLSRLRGRLRSALAADHEGGRP